MNAARLSDEEIQEQLQRIQGWTLQGDVISREFTFQDFPAAMMFMNRLAPIAERLEHHPDWSNSYNKVTINLTSHEAGGLTQSDFDFALEADTAARLLNE